MARGRRLRRHPVAVPRSLRAVARARLPGWVRGSAIEIADLSWVLVPQRRSGPELVLCAGDRTVVCPATVRSLLRRVDPRLLADWLGQALAPPRSRLATTTPPWSRPWPVMAGYGRRPWPASGRCRPRMFPWWALAMRCTRPGNMASQGSPPTMSSGVPSGRERCQPPDTMNHRPEPSLSWGGRSLPEALPGLGAGAAELARCWVASNDTVRRRW
jgi:hypothetical protein